MAKQRNEIEEKYTWDLSTIFPTDEAFEAELAQVSEEVKKAASPAALQSLLRDCPLNPANVQPD